MNILVTGAAGFIGSHLSRAILKSDKNARVTGFDNMNDYYDVALKQSRLDGLSKFENFEFVKGDLSDADMVNGLFDDFRPDVCVNLAAQAGVRYSITNPRAYIDSNIIGFFNILEACRHKGISHLIYASSSSVYGNQQKTPFSVTDNVDHPISLYAATKKSNELMAFTYSHLFNIPTTGLRFFTVYGPAGRPDMAYFSFTKKILAGKTIQVYNNGDMKRDFTYVDDIVSGILRMLSSPPQGEDPAKVYNIGNNSPENLMDYIRALEGALSRAYGRDIKANIEFLPMQAGDVYQTFADVDDLARDFGFKPETSIQDGLYEFAKWYRDFYGDEATC